MKRQYRVLTINANETYSVMNDWTTYGQCLRMILGRWGHWPPFAYISTAETDAGIRRAVGLR